MQYRKMLLPAIVMVLLVSSTSAGEIIPDKESVLSLVINTSSTGFDDDSTLFVGGGDAGGYAIVSINDDPILPHTFGGALEAIGQWVSKGKNTLRVEGVFTSHIYVKIGWRKGNSFKVIAKATFDPKTDLEKVLDFNIPVEYKVPKFAVIPRDEKALQDAEKRLKQIAKEIEVMIEKHQGIPAVARINEGRRIWMPHVLGVTNEALREVDSQLSMKIDDKNSRLVAGDSDREFNMILGERVVLMYRSRMNIGETPSSFRIKSSDGKVYSISPLRFVLIEGKWIIWS